MTGLDDIVLAEMKSLDDLENMLECSSDDSVDYFVSDKEMDEYSNEICPRCGHKLEDCECDDDEEEIYYYKEELDKDELDEIDDEPYDFVKESKNDNVDYNVLDTATHQKEINTILQSLSKTEQKMLKIDNNENYNEIYGKIYFDNLKRPLGYVKAVTYNESAPSIEIAVHKSWRNKGLAKRMLLDLINSKDIESNILIYSPDPNNTPSINLAKSVGFKLSDAKGVINGQEVCLLLYNKEDPNMSANDIISKLETIR